MRTARAALRLVAASIVAAAPALVAGPWPLPAAGADETLSVGDVAWWTRSPVASAPEGGFEVAVQPDGVASVAAFTLTPAGILESASVTLREAGGARTDQARLQLCVTTQRWDPASGGSLDAAPEGDCTRSATLLRSNDGRWSADVLGLLEAAGAPVAVVVVPLPSGDVQASPAGDVDPGYTVDVGAVEATGVLRPSPSSPDLGAGNGGDGSDGFDTFDGGATFDSFELPPPAASPAQAPALAQDAGAVTPPLGAPVNGSDAPETAFPVTTAAASGGDGRPWGRLVVLVPAAALVGAAAALVRDRLRGDDVDAGIL